MAVRFGISLSPKNGVLMYYGIILSEYSTAAGGKAPLVFSSIQGVFPCISSLSNKRFYLIVFKCYTSNIIVFKTEIC